MSLLILAASFIYLLCAAGHRGESEEIILNVQDRIPLDIYLLLWFGITSLTMGILSGGAYYGNLDVSRMMSVFFGFFILEAMLLALIMTMSTRLKKGGWWRNALAYYVVKFIWQVCKAILSTIGDAIHALPSTWKVAVGWLVVSSIYLTSTYAAGVVMILNFVLLIVFCSIAAQWQKLSRASKQLSAGNLEYKVDTRRMFRSFRQHGEDLNNISEGIAIALNQKMKSERLRTELITNVSHDIKTPLTSIINYVDLLKKQDIDNPKAQEYIEVLDRKSQRLKKLTEDLVEASKASTGSLSVHLDRLGMVQLVQQALGEFEEKFAQSRLTVVPAFPEEECSILADGRHLWRVIDNLLSNCNKYALEGTRIYVEVCRWEGKVVLSIKNISRQPLNIPAERLMERFVRGEESRTTEGSGLGLSIARSLTELQGGAFRLDIDGDLFKAVVSFPEAAGPELPANA